MEYVLISDKDNVKVCLDNGHKYAVRDIKKGEQVIKYGFPIGVASEDIKSGEQVHSHNLKTSLAGTLEYTYSPVENEIKNTSPSMINAFVRKNGDIGIRNDIWIIPTVGCVNSIAKSLADKTGAFCFTHPYGCSQLGDDLSITQKVLCGLVKHPNAGGVLVLGLGCENNNIAEFKKVLDEYDKERVRFLNCQDCDDEISEGEKFISIDLADGDLQTGSLLEMIKQYPDLKIAIGHFGMVTRNGWTEQIKLAQNKNVMIESGGITWLFNSEFYPYPSAVKAVKEAINICGIDKLMWGSDYPRTMVEITYKMSFDFVLKSKELTDIEKEKFLFENAKAFYGFDNLTECEKIKNML